MGRERLQKILARAGVASRRRAEDLILAGRVRVGGRVVTELGAKADARRDAIQVDGRRIVVEKPVYVLLHKPRGVVSTMRDPERRKTVAELVRGAAGRVVPVGRLDYKTSGVLLLTNDGEFANGLLHPSKRVPRVYVTKVRGEMSEDDLEQWRRGVVLDGKKTNPAEARLLRHESGKTWLELTLREGQNRQIVRMGEATGFPVMRLARTEFAGLTIDGLKPGRWRYLTSKELTALKKSYRVPRKITAPPEEPPRQRRPAPRRPSSKKRRSPEKRARSSRR